VNNSIARQRTAEEASKIVRRIHEPMKRTARTAARRSKDMRNVFTVVLLSAMLAGSVSAVYAQPPVDGEYKTQLGEFLEGRYSIAWPGGNGYEDLGNPIHVESWDGSALGTEWRIYCPIIASVVTLYNIPVGPGSYIASYLIVYVGGNAWLDGSGPWGGGDPSYSGVVSTYIETRSVQVVSNVLTGLNSDHAIEANIVGYPSDCVALAIGNSAWIGDTPQHGAKPAGYPAYLDPGTCLAGGTQGHWGTATDLTLTVQGCEVGVEESSWGSVKARYR
jgi:hypothetical protein